MRSSMRSPTPALTHARRAIAVNSSLTSQHSSVSARRQAAGDAERRVPGERAHLDGVAGAHDPGEQGQQRPLVGADLHPAAIAERVHRLVVQRPQHLVGWRRPGRDVVEDGGVEEGVGFRPGTELDRSVGGRDDVRSGRRRLVLRTVRRHVRPRRRGRRRTAGAAVSGGARLLGRYASTHDVPRPVLGRADHLSDQRGHPRLRMRHLGFRVGTAERDHWLAHMARAVDATTSLLVERGIADRAAADEIAAELMAYFTPSAEHLHANDTGLPITSPRASVHDTRSVAVRGLVKRYADVTAVDGLSLDIAAGEVYGLLCRARTGRASRRRSRSSKGTGTPRAMTCSASTRAGRTGVLRPHRHRAASPRASSACSPCARC